MSEHLLGLLVSWFPMLLLIAVWIFFMKRFEKGGRPNRYREDHIAELRKQNALLERIAKALEQRGSA